MLTVFALVVGICGYLLGDWSGSKAKEQLAWMKEQSSKAILLRDGIVKDLRAQLDENDRKFARERDQQRAIQEAQRAKLSTQLEQQSARLRKLENSITSLATEKTSLQNKLRTVSNSDEKAALIKKIASLSEEIGKFRNEQIARQCTIVTVPDDLLAAFKGAK